MKSGSICVLAVLLLARAALCDREVVFIGLSGEGAPAMEKTFKRLFQEHLAVMPGVHAVGGDELERLQARINDFPYPTVTAPLLETLGRFVSDTALVVWGKVKECSIRPVRWFLVGAAIRGDLEVEMTIYAVANRAYRFIGDVKATKRVVKEFIFFHPIGTAVHVSPADRIELLRTMQSEVVSKCGHMIESVLLSEMSRKAKAAFPSAQEKKQDARPAPVSADTAASGDRRTVRPDSVGAEMKAVTGAADTSAVPPSGGGEAEAGEPNQRKSE